MAKEIISHSPKRCQYDAGQIFRGEPSGVALWGYDLPSPRVPALDQGYALSQWQVDLVQWWAHAPAQPVFVCGPAGCGKTSGLKQLAARVNQPVYEVTGHDAMQPVDLEGCLSLGASAQGVVETRWLYGPLASAMREGALFIFNEIDMANPASLVALNTVLDGSPLVIEQTGEAVSPAPGFMFAATGNSAGAGDASGAYAGVMRQNFALVDRFLFIEAEYMRPQEESSLLMRRVPGLPAHVALKMACFADLTRRAAQKEAEGEYDQYNDLVLPVSSRALARWGRMTMAYLKARDRINVLEKAMMLAFGNARDEGQRRAYKEILQRVIGEEFKI